MTEQQKTQSNRFIETARAVGADEDMAAFRAKLGVVARHKSVTNDVVEHEPKKEQSK